MNQARNNLAGLTSDGEPQVRWSAWFSGDSCGKPLLKGGHHEAQLSPRGQTELPRAIGMDAVVTMYDRSGGAMPSASPLNDQAQRPPRKRALSGKELMNEPKTLSGERGGGSLERMVRPCVTHHHSCDCRERAIRALLEEVMWWHSDPSLAEYNGCDTEPCLFCELAKGLLDGTKNHDEIVRELHWPNDKLTDCGQGKP